MTDEQKEAIPDSAAPETKKHKAGLRAAFLLLLSLGFGFALIFSTALIWLLYHAETPGSTPTDQLVLIPGGAGLRDIAEQLSSEGFVSHDLVLMITARLYGMERSLKAGEYLIPAGSSMRAILSILQKGNTYQHRLTIPEGLENRHIIALLLQHEALSGEIHTLPPQGALAPETYSFPRGHDRQTLLDQIRKQQQIWLAEAWKNRADNLPLANMQEALVLASIIEKETGIESERRRVAGVFINRLRRGMRLQSDPTVIYALTGGAGDLRVPLTYTDLRVESPYNTYHIHGLPPNPIANPGRASIQAALNPEEHDYLYFVADGTGGHTFGRTLEEHNRNVAHWRHIQQQRRGK